MNAIVFCGQGNTKIADLRRLLATKEGSSILNELADAHFDCLLKQIEAAAKGRMGKVRYEIYSTFIANEVYFRRLKNLSIPVDCAVSHSAGIFNMLTASEAISVPKMLDFLEKRAKIFENYSGKEKLIMYMSSAWKTLSNVLINQKVDYDESIVASDHSGVISISDENAKVAEKIAGEMNISLKLHDSGIPVPYHSKYLTKYRGPYKKWLDDLFDKVNENKLSSLLMMIEARTLKAEILRQFDGTIHWSRILERMIEMRMDKIYDASPNEFLLKQFNVNEELKSKNVVGKKLWKMK